MLSAKWRPFFLDLNVFTKLWKCDTSDPIIWDTGSGSIDIFKQE